MEIAAKEDVNDAMLSFVHIVKDDDAKAHKVGEQENGGNDNKSQIDEDIDCRINEQKEDSESGSSDEEFEFE